MKTILITLLGIMFMLLMFNIYKWYIYIYRSEIEVKNKFNSMHYKNDLESVIAYHKLNV